MTEYPKAVLTDEYAKKIVWGTGRFFFLSAVFCPDPLRMAKQWTWIIACEQDKYGRLYYCRAYIHEMRLLRLAAPREFHLLTATARYGTLTTTLKELLAEIPNLD